MSSAKRALNFGTPASKRRRTMRLGRPVRLIKPEMKHVSVDFSATPATGRNLNVFSAIAEGTGIQERIGHKIKVWALEFQTTSLTGHKVELLVPYNTGATPPANTYFNLPDRTAFSQYGTFIANVQTAGTNEISRFDRVRFPMGLVVTYDSAGTLQRNLMYIRTTSPSSTAVVGQCRVWYTDA